MKLNNIILYDDDDLCDTTRIYDANGVFNSDNSYKYDDIDNYSYNNNDEDNIDFNTYDCEKNDYEENCDNCYFNVKGICCCYDEIIKYNNLRCKGCWFYRDRITMRAVSDFQNDCDDEDSYDDYDDNNNNY